MIKNKKLVLTLIIYTILFYAAWAITELVVCTQLKQSIGDGVLFAVFRDVLLKNLIWTLPALLLIGCYKKELFADGKTMFTFRKDSWIVLPLLIFLSVFVLSGVVIREHGLTIKPSFGADDIIMVLFVGLTEELVFRGWFLNTSLAHADTDIKKYAAVAVNAVMFLCIHFPIWIAEGEFVTSFTSFGFISILLLSVLFSISFIRTKNIVVPIILHSVYDLLICMFVE